MIRTGAMNMLPQCKNIQRWTKCADRYLGLCHGRLLLPFMSLGIYNNVFEKILLIVITAFITSNSLYAQTSNTNKASAFLKSAKYLFQEKKYKESIAESDRGLIFCGNQKDSLYIELLTNKALCYNWLKKNDLAIPMLKEAITIYQSQGKKDQLFSHICRYYCNIAYPSTDKQFYHNCVLNIFRTRHLHKNDYKLYKESFLATYGEMDFNQLSKALEREEFETKGLFDGFYTHYFEYLKGYVYSFSPSGRVTWDRTKEEKIKAIPFFENAITGFKSLDTILSKEVLIGLYSELADIYEALGQNASSALMHREILSLLSEYWVEFEYKSPWSLAPNFSAHEMQRFEYYIEQLGKAKMYQAIIDYCLIVLDDPRLPQAGNGSSLYVLEALKDAYDNTGDTDKSKEILKRIESYKKGIEENKLENDDNNVEENDYELLLKEKKYNEIIELSTNTINSFLNDVHNSNNYGFFFSTEEVASGKCSMHEFEVDCEREEWHHANLVPAIWESYYYRALAYLHKENYEKSIKDQLRVVEIVCLDWKYDKEERKDILSSYISGNYVHDTYLETELDMTMQLAYIYLKAGRHADAFKYYKKVKDINLQVLQTILSIGSQSFKEEKWDNRNYAYYSIIHNLTDKVKYYPRYSELILEATTMIKGWMLNLTLKTKKAITKSDLNTRKVFEEKCKADKLIELSCYIPSIDLQNATIKSQNASIAVNSSIGIENIIRESQESVSSIRNKLSTNDVLVDFYTIYKGDDIEKEKNVEIWYKYDDEGNRIEGDSAIITSRCLYSDDYLYACVMRKEWQRPKIVHLGKISDAINNNSGKDLIDYVYYNNNAPTDINALYRSTAFAHFVWDKIVSEGRIQKGESIYFIPTGLFNRIAIESLPLNNNQLVSDNYHVYRLSSIRELHHIQPIYKQNDKCVAFGGITYYSSLNNESLTNSPKNEIKTMAANPEAILDRRLLDRLDESTRSVIETISQVVNNTKLVTGAYANEKAFYELDGHSPDILFLGTHGYNFEKKELGEEESAYLFGDRRKVYLSDNEKGMYTSGLYLAPSKSPDITTDGMLTAKEISMCDLSGTKLAVLSACSTAIGVSSQEGVYGVQRGFKMAGVKSIVASLWEVDEKPTQILMTEFFKQYTSGKNIHKALRLAQKFVRDYVDVSNDDNAIIRAGQGKIYNNPYYWAGFILID